MSTAALRRSLEQRTLEVGWRRAVREHGGEHLLRNVFCPTGQGGGVDASCSPAVGYKGSGTKDDPARCGKDLRLAAVLLSRGMHVRLKQPDQVATLVDKMSEMIDEARKLGDKAPEFDLCKVTAKDTNLFCQESKGIPRIKMPQMRGVPVPGTYASTLPAGKKSGKVDLSADFIEHLKDQGIKTTETEVKASHLRASQNQIVGSRVVQLIKETEAGDRDLREKPMFVTRDNYIVDGHHHWAAIIGHGAKRDKDLKIPVYKLDMDIGQALDMANDFTKKKGLAPKSGTTNILNRLRSSLEERTMKVGWKRAVLEHGGEEVVRNAFCPTGKDGGRDNSCPPRRGTSDTKADTAEVNTSTREEHTRAISASVDKWLLTSVNGGTGKFVTEGKKQEYREAYKKLCDTMPEKTLAAVRENLKGVRFQENVEGVQSHMGLRGAAGGASQDGHIIANGGGLPKNVLGKVLGSVVKLFTGETGFGKEMGLIGDIHAHEISHTFDNYQKHSRTADWQIAFKSEIDVKGSPLTNYARSNTSEGFAEFGRLVMTNPKLAENKFPKCWDYWKRKELV